MATPCELKQSLLSKPTGLWKLHNSHCRKRRTGIYPAGISASVSCQLTLRPQSPALLLPVLPVSHISLQLCREEQDNFLGFLVFFLNIPVNSLFVSPRWPELFLARLKLQGQSWNQSSALTSGIGRGHEQTWSLEQVKHTQIPWEQSL